MGPQLADLITSGDVKVEVRHFPIQQRSLEAIKAVECAGEQGYWWAMHDHILANQAQGTEAPLMKRYAKEMGLDTQAFNQCYAGENQSHKYVGYAIQQAQEAQALGVQGTPTFFINGKLLPLQSFDDVLAAVKKELNP